MKSKKKKPKSAMKMHWMCSKCTWTGPYEDAMHVMYRGQDWEQCPSCRSCAIPLTGPALTRKRWPYQHSGMNRQILIEFNEKDLPKTFAGKQGFFNLVSFLHECFLEHWVEKRADDVVHKESRKAFYDKQRLNGQDYVDEIERINNDRVALGTLFVKSLTIEKSEEGVSS